MVFLIVNLDTFIKNRCVIKKLIPIKFKNASKNIFSLKINTCVKELRHRIMRH